MGKFKVGDTVSFKYEGKTYKGVVIEINERRRNKILCRFDGFKGHYGSASIHGPYKTDDHGFCYEEELTKIEQEKTQPIVIYRKDREVIALDKNTGKKAVAKCNPTDKFDFNVGAKLAFERLMEEKPTKSKTPHLENTVMGTPVHYGTLGTKTPYKDKYGRSLFVGDKVKINSVIDNIDITVNTVVVKQDGDMFLMGIQLDCNEKTGTIDDWEVTKIKDYSQLKINDVIEVAPHINMIVKA